VEAGDAGTPYIHHHSKSPAALEFAKALAPILALDDGTLEAPVPSDNHKNETAAADNLREEDVDSVIRFAIPTSDGRLCAHFGHCQEFTLIDVEASSKHIRSVTAIPAPEHEPGLLPAWLADRGASFIIAGGMGSRAQQLFGEQGVTVVTGASMADPVAVVQQFLEGTLVTGENVCDH